MESCILMPGKPELSGERRSPIKARLSSRGRSQSKGGFHEDEENLYLGIAAAVSRRAPDACLSTQGTGSAAAGDIGGVVTGP